jgi:predicted phage terminase large subunit-like protein
MDTVKLVEEIQHYERLLQYEAALLDAQDDLISFSEVVMPARGKANDITKSAYIAAKHHRFMADMMMRVEAGETLKTILSTPPRHGKSQLCTINFAAWFSARNPEKDIIVATYNETFAVDFGKKIKELVQSPRFRQVFPDYELRADGKASDHMITSEGGNLYFLGRRSATTGRGGDLIIVDDPTKDDKEARSEVFKEDLWEWFTQTLLTRRHHDKAAVCVTQTRWIEDDIIGRITDRTNPSYSPKFAEGFEHINLAAIAEEDDPIGRRPGQALWPERFGKKYLEEMREANAVSYAALYQGNPTPEDGVYFQKEDIFEYDADELPKQLRMYVTSDHAVGTKQINDPTCMVPYGICENDIAWILPGVRWRRMSSMDAVEEMIEIIRAYNPMFWYAEKGHISKAIGPFLKKRMAEESVYVPVIETHPVADKIQRAQSGRARCAQGKIRFPRQARWWPRAKAELLKFPNARNDDFVDNVSMIGMRLNSHTPAGRAQNTTGYAPGTFGHMLKQFRDEDAARVKAKGRAGW